MQNIIIAGAGPAGLTAALQLAKSGEKPIICEAFDMVGGISRTINYRGNRIDIGGHRFFTKNKEVKRLWEELMPVVESGDYDRLPDDLRDPGVTGRVMLRRRRISRIYYRQRFFDYPVKLSRATLKSLGLRETLKAGSGYLVSLLRKLPENNLENFYINRFGRPLYRMFFEDYTQKVWGKHPSELGADWGHQRVKGLSILAIIKDILKKSIYGKSDNSKVETSLIEEFIYPKYGPGQLWEIMAEEASRNGVDLELNTRVSKIHINGNRVEGVSVTSAEATDSKREVSRYIPCEYFLSSMPIKDLIEAIEGVEIPEEIRNIARNLPYRDFTMVGLLVDKLKIENNTNWKTFKNRIPDTWIYIQERNVKLGRLQIFNNWSPYMVEDYENKVWIGLEYFCSEGDALWEMTDKEFINLAIAELESIGIIDSSDVKDSVRIKIKKAYPAYYGSYYQLDKLIEFLNSIENLYCIGRNGQHRYNNMDHSMFTAIEAVNLILENKRNPSEKVDKSPLWKVNTEEEYHEEGNQ